MKGANVIDPSKTVRSLCAALRARVRIDTRTLAVFRLGVAMLILADLFLRARNFSLFYTDQGVVPQSLATEAAPVDVWSVYFVSTEPAVTAALFVLQGLLAVQLLVGYRTRIATVLSLVFVVSLDLRNPLVLSYADVLFWWLLFWAIFLPLDERWSIDAVHADRQPRDAVANPASALILLQMITMYVVNGYHKSQSELWTSGEAAILVLGLDDMTFLLADLVGSVPSLLQYGGLAWYYMLLFSWLLVLARGRTRTALVSLFMFAHLSFAVTVRIGAFAFVAIAGLCLFLQSSFWNDLEALSKRIGVPAAADSAHRSRLEAIATSVPRWRLGIGTSAWIPREPRKIAVTVAVAVFTLVALVSILSAGGLVDDDAASIDGAERGVAAFVDHQTEWSIFAPTPRTSARYYVFPAETEAGDQVDVYNDRPLTYERPDGELQKQYDTYRERFYMNSVSAAAPPDAPTELAEHICTEWNTARSDELTHVNMYLVEETVTLETAQTPAERDSTARQFYTHGCGDNEPKDVGPPSALE